MESNARATVSVAIPVYNGESFLAEALASVAAQSAPPDETLVFDNASTDRTRDIAGGVLSPDAIRTSSVNQGAVGNFNRAVRESSGEYFAWLAADDRFSARFLERTAEALARNPQASACLPAIQFIDPDGRPKGQQRDADLASDDAGIRLRSFLRRPRWTESYCLYRREALLASPLFTDAWGADVLLTWWFMLRGPLMFLDEPLYEYRIYPVKVAAEVEAGLNPARPAQQWRMTRLWRDLRRATYAPDVDAQVAALARRELLLALADRHWVKHLAWDGWMFLQTVPGLAWTERLWPLRRESP